jgi:uncharacterized protein YdhG (YjbR/CyaY superfamily)
MARKKGLTEEEQAAMKERLKEQRAGEANDGASVVLAKIAEMEEPDRTWAGRVHAIITANAPDLVPRLWYGMPAYSKDGNVLCFFQNAQKFKARYATLGFNDRAHLDEEGGMWPVAYALTELTPAAEERIAALIRQAVR